MKKANGPVVLINRHECPDAYVVAITNGSPNFMDAFLMVTMELEREGAWINAGYYMAAEIIKLRQALDTMLNDLNASIRREQAEREKNAKLLARIEELESCKIVRLTGSDITHIMQQEWNEYCDDTGCCPDDFRVDEGTGYLEFDAGTWANKVASRIIRKLPTLTETLRD